MHQLLMSVGNAEPMRHIRELLSAFGMLAMFVVGLAGSAIAEDAASLDAVLAEIAPPPSDQALTQIPDPGRKLLALRSYVRYGAKIADRWSWTEEQIKAFQGSPEQQALLAAIAAVNEHFKASNPGYEIYVHGTVRSLDDQLASWNKNESVGRGRKRSLPPTRPRSGRMGWSRRKSMLRSLMHGCVASCPRSGPIWPRRA